MNTPVPSIALSPSNDDLDITSCSSSSSSSTRDSLERLLNIGKRLKSPMKSHADKFTILKCLEKVRNKLRHKSTSDHSLHIEYIDNDYHHHKKHTIMDDADDSLELPDHNFSTSLELTDLNDGIFTAQIHLNELPKGHITIQIRNYKMEVIVHHGSSADPKHCISQPIRYGDIQIPIYVDPASLQFELDSETQILFMVGLVKDYYGNTRSLLLKTKYGSHECIIKDHKTILSTEESQRQRSYTH